MHVNVSIHWQATNNPFSDGHIPQRQSNGIFISHVVTLARINSPFNSFTL